MPIFLRGPNLLSDAYAGLTSWAVVCRPPGLVLRLDERGLAYSIRPWPRGARRCDVLEPDALSRLPSWASIDRLPDP